MTTTSRVYLYLTSVLSFVVAPLAAHADEGMWLFTDPPREYLQREYGFSPTDSWLEHLQRASVRFNNGGSGSFVSSDGLVMTNQHVGAGAIQKLSTRERDLLQQGFYARTREEEIKCLDLELNVLVNIEDVTERVQSAVKPGSTPENAEKARRAAMSTLEQESFEATGLRSDVVTLYRGGLYHLYRYKRYTDVRLVFAPEHDIAFFGGDPDNFEFPRYVLDISFFRVYEDDKPAKIEHFLRWNQSGPSKAELVFVAGHPGSTDRLNTLRHLEFLRDRVLPGSLDLIRRREVMLSVYSSRSQENARRAKRELLGYQNARKARLGALAGLQDPALTGRKKSSEQELRQAVDSRPELRNDCGGAWDEVASAIDVWNGMYQEHRLLESGGAFNSTLFSKARTILRLAEEAEKPNAERLREYRESNLPSLKQQLFSAAPIYKDLETVKLADSLGMFMEMAGARDELVQRVLDGKSPVARADELVRGTQLDEVSFREKLTEGGLSAVRESDDPMILLARMVDPVARRLRTAYEQQVEEPLRQAYAKIARARFALGGKSVYPDATFTLRLAFGTVDGYSELGRDIPAWTAAGGAFEHAKDHGHEPPFRLPELWRQRKDQLDLTAPLNFVCTPDITGGNSGSPVVNRDGQLVGIIFDGNRHSLVWDYMYTDEQGRAIAVHSQGIMEALTNIYQAGPLVEELSR